MIYAKDPHDRSNFPIYVDELQILWTENWQLNYGGVAGNTGILISANPKLFYKDNCMYCKKEFSGIRIPVNMANNVICPNCDKWNAIKS